MMKRILTFLLSAALILSGFPMTSGIESHAAEKHWADQYLNNLVRNDIMRGDLQGNLHPNNNITRAEFVTMINRAFGYTQKGKGNFADVDKNAWYSDDISIAKNQGYMQGVAANKAEPESSLTREQAVTLICRALKIEGVDSDTFKFSDSREFSQWSKEYINAITNKKIVNGYPDSTFKPANRMTRGEMAKVLSNLAGEIVKEKGDNYIGYADKNVSMVKTGANLRDTIIPGDLFITAGLGKGASILDKVTVNGDLIISGTGNSESGEVSVLVKDSDINHLIIDSQSSEIMSVRAEGGSVIEKTTVKRNAYLEEDSDKNIAFKDVVLKGVSGTKLNMAGNFENVKIMAANNQLSLSKGYINALTVDEEADKGSIFLEKETKVGALMIDTPTTVTGTGEIEQVVINADGTNISMLPKRIYIRPGIKAIINGKTMTSLDGEANNADPEFKSDYPKLKDIQATGAKLLAVVNKPGKVYWAIKDLGAVKAGATQEDLVQPDKRYFVKFGNQIMVGDKETPFNIAGLKSGGEYEYYVMFEDLKGNRTEIRTGKFKTVDIVAPQFLGGTPTVGNKTNTSFEFSVMPSKDVNIYWAVYKNKAVPPTAEALAEQKVSGALGKGELLGAETNVTYNIGVRGNATTPLEESKDYDIYFVMRDKAGNLSRLSKTVAATLDMTPPRFEVKPWNEPGAKTSITVNTIINEASTIYWAAYPQDEKYPQMTDVKLQIRTITTGDKAFKHGQKMTKGMVSEKLILNGLQPEKPYDVYFVARDKTGNDSDVYVLHGIKTLDKTAPKAEMVFDKVIDGDPLISANITIEFDEITYYDGLDSDIRLSTINGDDALKTKILKEMLILHDLKRVTQPDFYTDIDYTKVTIGELDGKTFITFPPSAFGKAGASGTRQGLNSGGRYQFEINKAIDSDGNRMNQATKLKAFNVVAPQIGMQLYTDRLELNEIGFSIRKIDSINSDSYYDIIISSDRLIEFDIYEKNPGEEIKPTDRIAKNVRIEKNQGKSLTQMVAGKEFKEFATIKDKDYKLVIHSLDATKATYDPAKPLDGAASWDGDLNLKSTVVTGTKGELQNLANSITNKTNTMGLVANSKLVQQVSNPKVFTATRTYADTAPPRILGAINFLEDTVFDTTAYATVMTDKAAEIYYVVVPFSDFVSKGNLVPTVDQVLAGRPTYIEGKTGKITINSGNVDVREFIKDLKPNTPYKFFYVIKGKSSDNLEVRDTHEPTTSAPSLVDATYKDFTTKPPIKPEIQIIDGVQQLMPTGAADEKSASVKGTATTEATVYWVAYVHSQTPQVAETDVDKVIEMKDNDALKADSGSFPVTIANDKDPKKEGIQFEFNVTNLHPTQGYDVFVALQNENSGAKSSKVYQLNGILRALDKEAPELLEAPQTTILNYADIGNGKYSYTASVVVKFTKPLYYGNQKGIRDPKPLQTSDLFTTTWANGLYTKKPGGLLQSPSYSQVSGISNFEAESEAITDIELRLTEVRNGTQVGLTPYIYSRAGWYAGKLVMTFVEDPPIVEEVDKLIDGKVVKVKETRPAMNGHFEVKFIK